MSGEIKELTSEWPDRLAAAMPGMDPHHQKIFALADSFTGAGGQVSVMTSLYLLCDYVNVHFRAEEALMQAEANPALAVHQAQHAWFREQLFALLEQAKGMSLDQVADEVRQLINGWLYAHVLKFDRQDIPCGYPADRRS